MRYRLARPSVWPRAWKRRRCRTGRLLATLLVLLAIAGPAARASEQYRPNIVIVSIDTLRADRLSGYGYERSTSPQVDRLMAAGVRFDAARTVEPLTGPALCSMITSLYPHQHAASRNGLSMRPGLTSLPLLLHRLGYTTAAFVGNWTLRDELTHLGDHFDHYAEVFSRKRWFGLFSREADGRDLTEESLAWLEDFHDESPRRRFFLWVHYTEPHAPYRLWEEMAPQVGLDAARNPSRSDRYDTEVAFADREVGKLLAGIARFSDPEETLVVFLSDHGENLGEHGYWGHGRHLYEQGLHIPLSITWPQRLPAGGKVEAPALIIDLAPTVLGLLGLPALDVFEGYDWSPVLTGAAEAPEGRVTYYQAHKGAVLGINRAERAREPGLLEVGRLEGEKKEAYRLEGHRRWVFDLAADPAERHNLVPRDSEPSAELFDWLQEVRLGLRAAESLQDAELDEEAAERLRSLGYIE